MTQQFILRVKPGSELDSVMQVLDSISDRLSEDRLIEAAGKKRAGLVFRLFGKFFDNLRVDWDSATNTYQMNYTDVVGDDRHYFLRVVMSSRLGLALTALSETKKRLSESQLQEIAGTKEVMKEMRMLVQSIDNLRVDWDSATNTYQMNYTDVVGSQAQQVILNVQQAQGLGSGATEKESNFDDIRWPQAPPILDVKKFDGWFIKPGWIKEAEAMMDNGSHISLASPPSIGKDTSVSYLAAKVGKPLVHVGGDAGLRKRDLIGAPEMANGSSYFMVSEFAAAVVNGWWADITEINAAEPDVILLLNGVLEEPHVINIRGKQYPVHPEFRLFVSYNPGLIGTKPLPQSFKDRFYSIKLRWFTRNELRNRLEAHGMPSNDGFEEVLLNGQPMVANNWTETIVEYGLKMWETHEAGQMRYQITFRRLNDAVKLMNLGVYSDVKAALKSAVIGAIDSIPEAKVAERVLSQI